MSNQDGRKKKKNIIFRKRGKKNMAVFLIPLIWAKLPNKRYGSSSINNTESFAFKATAPHRLIDFSTTEEGL